MATYLHRLHLHRPHSTPWLLVVALATALVGLGAWVVVDQTRSETSPAAQPTHGLAPAKVVAMLDSRFAALNSGGKRSFASYYSPDAVFHDFGVTPPIVARGADVPSLMEGYSRIWALAGQRITRESDVIQNGDFAAHALLLGTPRGMAVYEFDKHGKIAGQWVFGGG